MTFSILGLDRSNGDLGVAAASKFPGVRMTIPCPRRCRRGGHPVLRQYQLGPGLALLENGASPAQAVEILTGEDLTGSPPSRYSDAQGRAATFTGQACFEWAGVSPASASRCRQYARGPVSSRRWRALLETTWAR
jgi:uncharacterized Ntn-hydrolase superfamily protein